MAPLLGRKPFPLVKPLSEAPGEGEEVFVVEHSKEAFRSREDYEARLQHYAERVWTCKSTGSSQLTHKEAWDEEQEVAELLKEEFPVWYEKQVLEIVHHNTFSLDKLVDQSWMDIMTKYSIDEECDFEAAPEKYLRVKIVKIHPLENDEQSNAEKKADGACDSPSSDKENSSKVAQDNQIEEPTRRDSLSALRESDRARRSPRKLPVTLKKEEKKWAPPKFLPHKYDVKLLNEDKIISMVPVDSLYRSERPPNKEILRYFIRHNSLRIGTGENAPWVVEDELVKKYTLPSKFSDFLLDPHKYMTSIPTPATKRKSLGSPEQRLAKKAKIESVKNALKGIKSPLSPTLWCQVNLKKLSPNSPLKGKYSEEELQKLMKIMSPSKVNASLKKQAAMGKKKTHAINGQKMSGNARSPKKNLKNSKLKQMTLLDMAKGSPKVARTSKPGSSTPKSASKSHKRFSAAALHLIAYYRENKNREDRKGALSALISKATRLLSDDDRSRLPDELRELVQKRYELLEERKRWALMSEAERQEHMRMKREALKARIKEKARERKQKEKQERQEKRKRFEDRELSGKNLPTFKLVDTPEGLPNTLFGDVAMVVEFLGCYSDLLLPDCQYPVTAVSLMEALAAEKGGFMYLNRVLLVLLQTLLQDEIAEDYGELGMRLSEIPLTLHSASELVRLCLRKSDSPAGESDVSDKGDEDSEGSAVFQDDEVEDEFLEKLENSEFFELTTEEKLHILAAVCNRILMTYSVQDHVEAQQQRTGELWKERLAMLKEENDKKRAEKKRRKELGVKGKEEDSQAKQLSKKIEKEKEKEKEKETEQTAAEPESEDMISAVKSRRLQAMQAKKEKEQHEKLTKERFQKEAEEERVRKQRASAEKAFHEGIAKAKLVLRRSPLGTDRNHNRYWLFSDGTPGLFIEKGWVHDSINYSFSPKEEDEEQNGDGNEESEDADSSVGGLDDSMPKDDQQVESTVPKQGQNLWFLCDSQKEFDELMDCLHPQGYRESQLKERLEKKYQDILHSIHLARKQNLGLKTCDGHQELLNFLRTDIIEVATRLQKGGLGYLDDTTELEEKVRTLENLKDFGECIISLQAAVLKKFLQGFMAPKEKKKRKTEEGAAKAEEQSEEKRMAEAAKEMAEAAKVASAVEKWKTAIREAQTFSRMHVLLGMLDACIKWDMSSANARCKVCRKKGEDDKLILCDECNKAFHLFCLRPVLLNLPDGEWLCPACQPATFRRSSRARNYAEDSTNDDDDEEEEDEEDDEEEEDYEEEAESEDEQEVVGLRLRSHKAAKLKTRKPIPPKRRGRPPKNVSTRTARSHTAQENGADVDEVIRQSKPTSRRQNQELQKCEEILCKLLKYRFSWPFREPVNTDDDEGYLKVVATPMDFQTMQSKCSCGNYQTVQEFLNDLKLVFGNAELYYEPGSQQMSCLEKTEQCVKDLLGKHLPGHAYQRRHRKHQAPEPESNGRERKRKK